nr:DUF11 domain-containing protein [Anaerolineae bacterium]
MTLLPPPPELAIGKVASKEQVEVGLPLSYTIVVTNTGGPATGVVISDTLPASTLFAWASDGGTLTGGEVVWSGLGLPAGSTLTVTYGVTVTCVSSGTLIVNDGYQVYAGEWPTPTSGLPVTVTAVAEGVSAEFTFPTPVLLDRPVAFTNLSRNGTSYEWAFGDGGFSSEAQPAHVYAGIGSYTVVLTASNICDTSIVSHSLTVENYEVSVSPAAESGSGDPGAVVTYTLLLTNTGTLSDTFQVTAGGNDWPTQLSTGTLPLDVGQEATVVVEVTVPAGTVAGAQDSVFVTVRSLSDPRTPPAAAQATLTTTANTVYGVALGPATASQVASPGETVTYTLQVTNTGNITDIYGLSHQGSIWPVALSPSGVFTLGAGAWRNVAVYATVPVTATLGEQAVATIQVAGTGVSDTSTLTTTVSPYQVYLPLLVRD